MRYFRYLGLAVACLVSQGMHSQTLAAKIDEIIEQQVPRAMVGVLIKDVQSGEVIYSRNADKLLTPASSTKLFTAAAALYYLKTDFHFSTTLSQKDQNFYLSFSGSPSLTTDNLMSLLAALKKNNIKTIKGNIVIDSSHHPAPYYLSGDSFDDFGWAYTAPDTAVVLNENAETYELSSGSAIGLPAQIRSKITKKVKPKSNLNALHFTTDITTVSKEDEKNHCSLHVGIKEKNSLHLFGCMVQNKNPKTVEFAIPDPVYFAKQVTQKALLKEGIVLKGRIIEGATPKDAHVLAEYQSANLNKLLKHMLQKSDNLYANTLTRKLGYLVTGKGTHKEGIFAIKKIISEHTTLDMQQMELVDGEGTRYNLIAPEHFVALLTALYQNKNIQPVLLNALPKAGVSGTLQGRMKNTILEKKVFAKTGSMHDVSSLSGFIVNPNARTFVFSIITNGLIKSNEKAKVLEEKILMAVNESY